MTTTPDPADRLARVRAEFARQQAKLPRVDHNGRPIEPEPAPATAETARAEPERRVPGPNPALGSSANGAPDLGQQIAAAQKAGDWQTVVTLQRQQQAGYGYGYGLLDQ